MDTLTSLNSRVFVCKQATETSQWYVCGEGQEKPKETHMSRFGSWSEGHGSRVK
jgi:hypothetical protein